MSLSFFIFIAFIKSKLIKIVIAVIFLIFHVVLLSYFIQGYFIS
jgi:hypothetical protein